LIKGNWVNPNTGKIDAKVGDVTKSFDNMNSYERDFYNYWYPRYIMTKDLYDAEQAWINSGKDIKDFNYDDFFNTNDNWKKYIAAN
jgi:hypothetical protein